MNSRGDTQYFFEVERMVLEHQLKAALQRTAALRARALQLERILLHSQRRLNKL